MRPFDLLLLNVAAATRIRASDEQRRVAAREIAALPFPTATEYGPVKARATRGLRDLTLAYCEMPACEARKALSGAIEIAAKALRDLPDAPPAATVKPTTGPFPPPQKPGGLADAGQHFYWTER